MYMRTIRLGYVTGASCIDSIAATFVKLADFDANSTTADYVYVELPLASFDIPAGARLALLADPELTNNHPTTTRFANFFVDNFRVGPPVTCYAPSSLQVLAPRQYL